MNTIEIINYSLGALFVICYLYQFVYALIACVAKEKRMPEAAPRRYAVMIAARNEETVIGHLIDSIRGQDYPDDLVDIYVAADNCTDETAAIARKAGAIVFERFNKTKVGKGYALEFLYDQIKYARPQRAYDGFFIFDADNLLDEHFIAEMNRTFAAGYRIVTCYRNSKNYGDNWVSSGHALWFLREAKYLNNPRMIVGSSAAVSGTGFLIAADILERSDGWKYFMLTEDIEFTLDNISRGELVGYCGKAMIYDEQPTDFKVSWVQRTRWAKGNIAVSVKYWPSLVKRFIKTGEFGCFDMAMTIMPALILTFLGITVQAGLIVFTLLFFPYGILALLLMSAKALLSSYLLAFAMGALTGISEWKNIRCSAAKKIFSFFTFPIFMLTYAPISALAVFQKSQWKPIRHRVSVSIKEIN